jgi:acetyltransferase-like isoleucine patch superfamily enzyme
MPQLITGRDSHGDGLQRKAFRAVLSRRLKNLGLIVRGAVKARLCGAERFGKQALLGRGVRLELRGRAVFGDRFHADGTSGRVTINVHESATLSIGDDVYVNAGTWLEVFHDVRIGSNVLFGPYASIIDDAQHAAEPGAVLYKGPTVIGDNVWLGWSASVMPGVRVGDGSVIAAHSVVTSDIPPSSFAAGAPARVIRKLELPEGWIRS